MRLKETLALRHIHQWRLYTPPTDLDLQLYFEYPVFTDPDPWSYRKCDCGGYMRCLTTALDAYPKDFRAFADEDWESC